MSFQGQTVCVTGAGGSIGSELVMQLVKQGVKKLVLVSLTENGLYQITKRLKDAKCEVVGVLGSVTDDRLMVESLVGCDYVLHAAAHKHVPICEQNPLAAIDNNVRGTYVLATAARDVGVWRFVLVSSDKAVNPASVMGATKRVAELMIRFLFAGGTDPTNYSIVRFGNVMDSAGSVFPLWREQIKAGGPLTLTDPECERYFMSIPQAVELILHVAAHEITSHPHVFDMGEPRKMGKLARDLMDKVGRRVKIQTLGLRPGEKLREELDYGGERRKTEHPKIWSVREDARRLEAHTLLRLFSHVSDRNEEAALKLLREIVAPIDRIEAIAQEMKRAAP